MLTQIKIKGFKCFDELNISLKNLNLLTGINSSGKSSVIQSILLLMQQKEQGKNPLNGKYTRLGLLQDIKNSITNPKMIEIEVKDANEEEEKFCSMQMDMEGKATVSGIEILLNKDFAYLSAERIGAEDVYKQNLTDEYRIGIHGEYAFDYLSNERMSELREPEFRHPDAGMNLGNQVDYWLNYILGYYVTAERITGTEVVRVSYRRSGNGTKDEKPHHVGTGVSYVANVIISALSCKKGSLFIIENPEIHLHPGAQSKILEFFTFLASRGLQIVIETHSDHIFNGVRKRIKAGDILKDKVSVYFFEQDENYLSKPIEIQIDENGGVRNHEIGLFDQFDDDLDELLSFQNEKYSDLTIDILKNFQEKFSVPSAVSLKYIAENLWKTGQIDFHEYLICRYEGTRLDFSGLEPEYGFGDFESDEIRDCLQAFDKFIAINTWEEVFLDNSLRYKKYSPSSEELNWFRGEKYRGKNIDKFRCINPKRCFGYREKDVFHVLRMERDHKISDNG